MRSRYGGLCMFPGKGLSVVAAGLFSLCWTATARAQGKVLTDADYARAERFMSYNVNPLVYHTIYSINWLGDGRFWYLDRDASGVTYMLVDPAKRTKAPAFDHVKLAAALTAASAGSAGYD